MLAGLHGGTTGANVARAALEGIAWRVADIVAVVRESVEVDTLRVDGGVTNEPLLLELQADAIGVPVEAGGADATVAGAAALARRGRGRDRVAGGGRRATAGGPPRGAHARRRLALVRARALAPVRWRPLLAASS